MSNWSEWVIVAIAIAFLRFAFMFGVSLTHVFRSQRRYARLFEHLRHAGCWPPVSIIMPAYNEEEVIGAAIEAALRSDYLCFEIIVIDDGSSDGTAAIAQSYAQKDGRIQVLSKETNAGKAAALNDGIALARFDHIVTIDADTWLQRNTIKYLVLNLMEPNVGGVTANIQIGNQDRLLTVWQHIEFLTGQHMERRALSMLGCVTTLAGACSGFRKNALEAVGGFPPGTMAEDTDLTLVLLEAGYVTRFEPLSYARTEGPATIRDLYRQRFRWFYGNFECLLAHIRPVWFGTNKSRALAWIGFPNLAITGLLLFVLLPVFMDAIVRAVTEMSLIGIILLPSYLFADFIAAIFAVLVGRERKLLLLHALPQRFFWLFFMGFILMRAVFALLLSSSPAWMKARRVGLK